MQIARETHRDSRRHLSPPSRMVPIPSGVSTWTNASLGTILSALLAQFPAGLSRRANNIGLPFSELNIMTLSHTTA